MTNIIPLRGDDYYERKSTEYLELAMTAVSRERYEEALNYFKNSYQFYPKNEKALMYVGLTSYILGYYQEAIEVFRQLFEKDPTNYEYAYRYGRSLYEQERNHESIKIFEIIPFNDENFFNAQFYKAKSLHKIGDDADSVKLLIKLLSEYPDVCDIRFELASIYTEHKKYSAAVIELETCISLNEKYALAYYLLHDLYVEIDEIDKAFDILNKLEEKCPEEKELIEENIYILRKSKNRK